MPRNNESDVRSEGKGGEGEKREMDATGKLVIIEMRNIISEKVKRDAIGEKTGVGVKEVDGRREKSLWLKESYIMSLGGWERKITGEYSERR